MRTEEAANKLHDAAVRFADLYTALCIQHIRLGSVSMIWWPINSNVLLGAGFHGVLGWSNPNYMYLGWSQCFPILPADCYLSSWSRLPKALLHIANDIKKYRILESKFEHVFFCTTFGNDVMWSTGAQLRMQSEILAHLLRRRQHEMGQRYLVPYGFLVWIPLWHTLLT